MGLNATWLVATSVIMVIQIAYVRSQMRWARTLDHFTDQEPDGVLPSLDACDAEPCE